MLAPESSIRVAYTNFLLVKILKHTHYTVHTAVNIAEYLYIECEQCNAKYRLDVEGKSKSKSKRREMGLHEDDSAADYTQHYENDRY